MLRKVVRRGLAQEAADLLRQAVFDGHFPPGAPLKEVELAASLGVSRGSVRGGLALLEREGLVRNGWHRGATVVEVTRAGVEEVYTLQAALDRLAAVTARSTRTREQWDDLDRLVDVMAEQVVAGSAGSVLLASDLAFHDAVYSIAGNQRLTDAWHAVRSQVALFQLRRIALGDEHYRARVVHEHRDLAALLRDTDHETGARAAEEHVDAERRSLLAHL